MRAPLTVTARRFGTLVVRVERHPPQHHALRWPVSRTTVDVSDLELFHKAVSAPNPAPPASRAQPLADSAARGSHLPSKMGHPSSAAAPAPGPKKRAGDGRGPSRWYGPAAPRRPSCVDRTRAAGTHTPGRGAAPEFQRAQASARVSAGAKKPRTPKPHTPADARSWSWKGFGRADAGRRCSSSYAPLCTQRRMASGAAISAGDPLPDWHL